MTDFFELPFWARLYIPAVVVLGSALTLLALAEMVLGQTGGASRGQFFAYLAVAALASALKVNLPTITGTMSVNSLFILISIVQLRQGETMVIGLVGVLIQCLWRPRSPALAVRVVFSMAANAIAISASYLVFNHAVFSNNLEGIQVLLTAGTYFLVNTALVAMVVSLTEGKPVAGVWADCYFWCFPYYMGGAGIAWISTVLNRRFDWQVSLVLLPVVYFIYRSYKIYLQRLEDEKKHVEEMAGLHLRTIEALALAIEAKDHTTHDHLRRVRVYALEVGLRMGLSDLDLQSLRAAALLHDIGKLAVPEYIISKPGKLTQDEFEKMKIHPVVGAKILEQVQFPYPVAPIVLSHHEKWDGSGYPSGLKGEEIPIGARILSAVDALDALASDRQYRLALPLNQAMEIVAAESGRTFDPSVIRLLQTCYVELEHKAVREPRSAARLDTEPFILRGGAPATGFEQTAFGQLECTPSPLAGEEPEREPALTAALARQAVQDLHGWASSADSPLTLEELLAVFALRLRELIPYDAVAFYVKRGTLLIPEYVGGDNRRLFSSLRIPSGEGLSGWVAENRKPLLNGNPSVEAGYLNDPSKFSTLRSALAVPLEAANGVIGVLALYRTERDAFSAQHLHALAAVSHRAAQVLERSLFGAPSPSTSGDGEPHAPPVRLPNAAQLYLRLAQEIEKGIPFALVLCNLDRFSKLNRQFGRKLGDCVLASLSNALSGFFRARELVCHMGGDEFAILIPDLCPGELDHNLEMLGRFVEQAVAETPEPFPLGYSIGTAQFPIDGPDPDTLLAEAENSLQRAKQAKSGGVAQAQPAPTVQA